MTWEQLQQLIAEVGEGWLLYPGAGGVWVLERPDTVQMLPFTTPEELISYLRQYAKTGDQTTTPTPTPTPTPMPNQPALGFPQEGIIDTSGATTTSANPIQAIRDWFAGLEKGGTLTPAPDLGGKRPPKPPNWDKISGGRTWEGFFPLVPRYDENNKPIKGSEHIVFNELRAAEFDRLQSKLDEYNAKQQPRYGIAPPMPKEAPATGYEWYWDGNQWAQKKAVEKAPAKRPPYAGGPEYRGPDAQGNTWYQTGPDDEWTLLSKTKARTLTEALTDAILAEKPDQAEIDRLMGIINELEASSPNFIANEHQRAFQRQLALRDQALQEQKGKIDLARSPGDWLTWWSMMNRANQPTAEQFQRFGEERFAPAVSPQPDMMFAPAKNLGYGQPQFEAAQRAVQDEVEKRYQAWLGQAQGVSLENLTPEMLANARVGIEAQVKKEFPLPEALSFTGGYGTTNRAIYEEYQRRMKEGTPYQKTAVAQAQAGAPIGARTGLDWLTVARSGQPIPQQRLAPNIPGVPAFPNPQTWGNLLPSQQEAYRASVEMQGIPFADYWKQYQKQIPKGYAVEGMFKPRPSYVRR